MAGNKEYAKEVREWRKAHHMCVRCGNEKAYRNTTHCLQCLMARREYAREHYTGSSPEKALKAKEIRDFKKAHDICRQCSKKVYRNHAYCYEHYLSQKRAHEKYASERYHHYGELGLCKICGKPRYENHKLCKEHYEIQAERMRKINRERSESKEKALQEQYKVFREKGIFHGRKSTISSSEIRNKILEVWELDGRTYTVIIIDGRVTHVD